MTTERFWEHKSLSQMSDGEWESLCDGCARCCLHKLEDGDSGELTFTRVHCGLLDDASCRCRNYGDRSALVEDCIDLRQGLEDARHWLPTTCAYRLLAEGRPLFDWHPLVSGDADSVHRAGISIRGRVISDEFVHPDGYDEHIIRWVE